MPWGTTEVNGISEGREELSLAVEQIGIHKCQKFEVKSILFQFRQ